MKRSLIVWLICAGLVGIAGCSTMALTYDSENGWRFGSQDKSSEETALNQNWRSGYGFNNPNPDRIKNGKAPLNFDGSEYKAPKPW